MPPPFEQSSLALGLQIAAALQLGIAILNLFLVRLLKWQEELARMQLLVREVFKVHAWFISVTLAIFGLITWRFAREIAGGANPICQWLAVGIGSFWALRTVLQVAFYSRTHWMDQMGRTFIHIALLVVYGGMGMLYLWVAFSRGAGGAQ